MAFPDEQAHFAQIAAFAETGKMLYVLEKI